MSSRRRLWRSSLYQLLHYQAVSALSALSPLCNGVALTCILYLFSLSQDVFTMLHHLHASLYGRVKGSQTESKGAALFCSPWIALVSRFLEVNKCDIQQGKRSNFIVSDSVWECIRLYVLPKLMHRFFVAFVKRLLDIFTWDATW